MRQCAGLAARPLCDACIRIKSRVSRPIADVHPILLARRLCASCPDSETGEYHYGRRQRCRDPNVTFACWRHGGLLPDCCGAAGLTAEPCPAALHAASHARPGELRAASHAAPGDLHAALDAAPSLPSGPQHLTPLAAWLALRCPTLLVLQGKPLLRLLVPEGKPLYDVRSFPTTCFTPFDLH